MKTLERFWQWFDSEKPGAKEALAMARKNLSKTGWEYLMSAVGQIATRSWPTCDWTEDGLVVTVLDVHREPARDLSLALGRALEAMRATVREGSTSTFATVATPEAVKPFAREYLGEWVSPQTFFGVDRQRDQGDQRLSGARAPMSFKIASEYLQAKIDPLGKTVPLLPWGYTPVNGCGCEQCTLARSQDQERRDRQTRMQLAAGSCPDPGSSVERNEAERYRSYWREKERRLEIRPTGIGGKLSKTCCDNMRGLRPREIHVYGSKLAYDCEVWLYLMRDILAPMVADGATLVTE